MRKMRSINAKNAKNAKQNAKNAKQKCEKCGKTNNKSFLYTSHVRTTRVRTHDVTGYNLTLTSGTRRVRTHDVIFAVVPRGVHALRDFDAIWGV